MRTISYKLDDLKKVVIPIGYEGENDHTRVIIDAGEVFKQYPAAAATLKVKPPHGTIYPVVVSREGDTVIWDVKETDCASNGTGEAQFTFTENSVIVKSMVTKININRSLVATGPAPDPIEDWLDEATEVLDDLGAMDNIAKNAQASDIGKSLSPKTVVDGVVTEWQYVEQSGGTEDYTDLENKPSIAGVTLSGDKSLTDLGIAAADDLDDVAEDVSDVKTAIHGVDDNLTDEKANVAQIANNGYHKFFPEWERGAWGLSGKEVNANSMRSKDLIYLPSGVYTVYSVVPMSVFTYYDAEAQDGGNPQWKQTGEQTITITTRNYVGFAVEWSSTETGNPTGNYAIIPSAVSDVIAKANKTADDLAETSARTVFSDGTYNAVLSNVTVTENKGIGSGVLVGSVVSLTNDTYSQVMEVPVTAGRTYRMKARVYANYFIAHFTDSNNILIEKTGKNTTGATNTMVDFSAVAPAGATKLYIAGMKNTPILCDVFNPYTVKDIISMNENKARGAFCIMEFNVGDWYQGIYRDGDKTGIIPADETIYAQYMELFRDIFNRYKPDIALLNEEAQNMCMNRHDDSRAFLGEWWRYQYRGLFMSQDLSDVFNTIASCLPLSNITVRNFTDTESNMHRNYIKGYLYLNGKEICVICAHLSSNIDIAKLNATELLNDLQTEDPEYLICCGDFNYDTNVAEIAAFETAGYTISRGNVVHDGHTYGPGDLIVTTSNITVKSVFCDTQKIDASFVEYIDHLPTIAYLEIY